MKTRRTVYFLVHAVLVLTGALITAYGYAHEGTAQTILVAVGTGIVATGGAGMAIWVYLETAERQADRLENLSSAGMQWAYPRRAAQIRDEYATRLSRASHHIDIIGFGLSDFKRDYMPQLGSLSKRAQVRILLLDPESPFAEQRDREEDRPPGSISREIREFIAAFQKAYSHEPADRLCLQIYSTLPLVNIFRIDDDLFWGPYLMSQESGNTLTMRVARGGSQYQQLTEHFEAVWNTSAPPPPPKLNYSQPASNVDEGSQ